MNLIDESADLIDEHASYTVIAHTDFQPVVNSMIGDIAAIAAVAIECSDADQISRLNRLSGNLIKLCSGIVDLANHEKTFLITMRELL